MKRKSAVLCGAALAATVLLGAACSSSKSQTGASSTGSSKDTAKAVGTPVKVSFIVDESQAKNVSQAAIRAGIKAAVQRINNSGNGLGGSGHPIDLQTCVTNLDPNQAADCARRAANDPSVVATVGNVLTEDENSIFESAGLPVIPAYPTNAGDFSSPVVFLTNGGSVIAASGSATLAVKDIQAKRVGILNPDYAVSVKNTQFIDATLQALGAPTLIHPVRVPLTASDISSYVASAAQGVDAVLLLLPPGQSQQALLGAQSQGIKVPFVELGLAQTPDLLKSVGAAANGVQVANWFPTSDVEVPGNKQFEADVSAAGETDQSGDAAKSAWLAFQLLDRAAKGLTTLDRSTLLKGLKGATDFDGGGLTPKLDFSKPGPDAKFPRVLNWTYFDAAIKDGKLVSAGSGSLEPIPPTL